MKSMPSLPCQINMKQTIYAFTLATFLAGSMLSSCNSAEQKVENAEENLEEAKENLKEEKLDSIEDYRAYRLEVEQKIANNEARIIELRAEMKTVKKEDHEAYKHTIDRMEEKNMELKRKINEYDKTNKEKWEEFKAELNADLKGIGESLKDLGRDNK